MRSQRGGEASEGLESKEADEFNAVKGKEIGEFDAVDEEGDA